MKNIVVLTGAGISAESGIKTFRDSNGLWENHDIMEVASIDGWHKNPELVLDFYNKRRLQAESVLPNEAHTFLAELEQKHNTYIVTQNVDDLHERAGSQKVLHLHGKLSQAKSTINDDMIVDVTGKEIQLGDLCPMGSQLRPNIVWFGENVPEITTAEAICSEADIFIIIGTSLQVYPAAGLIHAVPNTAQVFIIDPNANELSVPNHYTVINSSAVEGVKTLDSYLQKLL